MGSLVPERGGALGLSMLPYLNVIEVASGAVKKNGKKILDKCNLLWHIGHIKCANEVRGGGDDEDSCEYDDR